MTNANVRVARVPLQSMVSRSSGWCATAGLALALSGCFYDSRWGQQKAMQKHEVARQTPELLHASSQVHGSRMDQRTFRLRVYATPAYSTTVVNWQKQFEDTLTCANSVFAPEFGVKFEVAEFLPFRPDTDEEKLSGLLAELTAKDAAEGVDWVVGLARAVPQFAVSAEDLGLAPLLGNHFVMRAMSDAHEYEAIERAFTKVSEDERRKLYHARKQHKLCTVFLHEVAHTLGVPHELSPASLMHPRYQVKAHGYSEEATEIVRAALGVRANRPAQFLDADLARILDSSLSAANADWEPSSRQQMQLALASFRGNSGANGAAGTRSAAPASNPPASSNAVATDTTTTAAGPAELTPEEQQTYARARAELNAGHGLAARQVAAPLLTKRANLPAIQSLRCDIAMSIGGDWETINEECPGMSTIGKLQ